MNRNCMRAPWGVHPILPAATVETEAASHLLAAVPFEDGRHAEPLAIIYRKNRKLTPAMTNFINALKQPGSL
ncbi:MAG: LysR substrate-binding domain-containing protein [Verrucomicrobiia bacterium]